MIYILHNAAAILWATLAGLAVGAAWLAASPARRPATVGEGVALAVTAAVAEGWFAAILAGALIVAPVKAGVWTVTLGAAAIIWAGFVLPSVVLTLRSRRLGWGGAASDALHWLAVALVQASVLRLVGVSAGA